MHLTLLLCIHVAFRNADMNQEPPRRRDVAVSAFPACPPVALSQLFEQNPRKCTTTLGVRSALHADHDIGKLFGELRFTVAVEVAGAIANIHNGHFSFLSCSQGSPCWCVGRAVTG